MTNIVVRYKVRDGDQKYPKVNILHPEVDPITDEIIVEEIHEHFKNIYGDDTEVIEFGRCYAHPQGLFMIEIDSYEEVDDKTARTISRWV